MIPTTTLPPTRARYRFGYHTAALTYLAMQAFSTVPSPLYGLYAVRDHLSPLSITLVYAAYAIGVAVSLVLAGHVSDSVGRRPVFVAALTVNAISAVVFIMAPTLTGLFVARVLCGLAVGVTASTATAYLVELFAAHRDVDQMHRVGLLTAAVSLGGLGVGGLVGGLIAALVPYPLTIPYVVSLGAFGACVAGLIVSPETCVPVWPRPRYRPQWPSFPPGERSPFAAAVAGVASVFALFGLFVGLAATVLKHTLHQSSPALPGLVLFVVFGVGVVSSAVAARLSLRPLVLIAFGLTVLGCVLLVIATWLPTPSLTVFVAAAALIGAGGAALFRSSLTVASALAPPEHMAATMAAFYLAGYLGVVRSGDRYRSRAAILFCPRHIAGVRHRRPRGCRSVNTAFGAGRRLIANDRTG
ncbi:MFS transporter [Williamsia sterculiae]|uniref:Predicted arabinose efflux permease, MFS family n=1 Tax=Williamsia sterculiae TaxID=1344003 RepID=A0A1N7EZ19_9NOCA|nr:MFS transporter [Williamsia sterculiae]SIR93307.1 Predicted arabinose efflux permease, MFS family [Williamsia sterculiae]